MVAAYAHSIQKRPESAWETLAQHASRVADGSEKRAGPIGFGAFGRAGGLLHDIGKHSVEFLAYLRAGDGQRRGPDHSTAGAVEALRLYPGPAGRVLAFVVAGHHAGLADGCDLRERLGKALPAYAGWEAEVGPLPEVATLTATRLRRSSPHRGFSLAFLVRMLFSCLVDADFVETEAFYAEAEGRSVERGGFTPLPVLHGRLQAVMAATRAGAPATAHCAAQARCGRI